MNRPLSPSLLPGSQLRRASDRPSARHWRVDVFRLLVPIGIIACVDDAIMAPTSGMRIAPLVSAAFLLVLWVASLLPGVSADRRMARFGDAMILCALLAAVAVYAWMLMVERDAAALRGMQRMALWTPLLALYSSLMLGRRPRLGVFAVVGLIALILVFHSYAMRSFGVPILPDTVINFIAMTVTTAGTAMIFGRYRRGVSDTFARLQVAEAQSMTDALTALPNRRKFRLDSASRVIGSRPHCLIVLDLDEFKRVNDSLGHQAGDHILKAFGDAVADQLPDAATLYRWGGEEFAILAFMQRTDAKVLAESLRRHIEKMVLPLDVHITASFGVTEILPEESVDAAFQRADAALYEAKHAGRNRSVFRAP